MARRRSVADTGTELSWNEVSFSVPDPSSPGKDKVILDRVSGSLSPGTVTAILGPSGSGKSSLLNILAGRISSKGKRHINGQMLVNGEVVDPVENRACVAYVMQDDSIMKIVTPREAMMFSAALRLGYKVPKEERVARVDAMLKELGLEDCADTQVGDDLTKGISGGERKRTSIGVELVTDPDLIFLDEPTSGLDAYAAWRCVDTLCKLANDKKATVLTTIHQPSSEVFAKFHNVIVLGTAGRVIYSGPVGGLVKHYADHGYPLPAETNPSDHALFVVKSTPDEELVASGIYDAKRASAVAAPEGSVDLAPTTYTPLVAAGYLKQTRWLLWRECLATYRDVGALVSRFGGTVFLNILFGLIFLDAARGQDSNIVDFNNHYGALVLITISCMFGSASPALLAFPSERPIFLREYSTGTFSAIPYVISKMLVEGPMLFCQVLLQALCTYFLVGFQGSFILIVLVWWLLSLASNSVAIAVGCTVSDVKTAAELTPLLFVPQLLFSGFFVAINQVPVWLRWAQWLCSLKYTLNLALLVEFNDGVCGASAGARDNCNSLFNRNDINGDDVWLYLLVLLGLFLGLRVIGAWLLVVKATTVY